MDLGESRFKLSINIVCIVYEYTADKVNVGNQNPSRDYNFTHTEPDIIIVRYTIRILQYPSI